MFRRPKLESAGAEPDPSDLENRRNSERKKRLATGGRQSTLLATAMERATTAPAPTLKPGGG